MQQTPPEGFYHKLGNGNKNQLIMIMSRAEFMVKRLSDDLDIKPLSHRDTAGGINGCKTECLAWSAALKAT